MELEKIHNGFQYNGKAVRLICYHMGNKWAGSVRLIKGGYFYQLPIMYDSPKECKLATAGFARMILQWKKEFAK